MATVNRRAEGQVRLLRPRQPWQHQSHFCSLPTVQAAHVSSSNQHWIDVDLKLDNATAPPSIYARRVFYVLNTLLSTGASQCVCREICILIRLLSLVRVVNVFGVLQAPVLQQIYQRYAGYVSLCVGLPWPLDELESVVYDHYFQLQYLSRRLYMTRVPDTGQLDFTHARLDNLPCTVKFSRSCFYRRFHWRDLHIGVGTRDLGQIQQALAQPHQPALALVSVHVSNCGFYGVQLSEDALRLSSTPNAGGSSILSEIFSCELLSRLLDARLLLTEMQVRYYPVNSPMTDYVCEIDGKIVSVSVTRAMTSPRRRYTFADARRLLRKKLLGLIYSTRNMILPPELYMRQSSSTNTTTPANTSTRFAWQSDASDPDWDIGDALSALFLASNDTSTNTMNKSNHAAADFDSTSYHGPIDKQVLHIWAPSEYAARIVQYEWHRIEPSLRANILVVLSIINQPWIFTNRV